MDNETIAAIATPRGAGGIGIIKISGTNSLAIAKLIFKRSEFSSDQLRDTHNSFIPPFKSHHLYHGYVVNPYNGRTLDEVLLTVMLSPNSYTKEDVVEINAHSGPAALKAILELVLKTGARLSAPGEFTKRAFINGRIDLTQAEAVIDTINAKTEKSLQVANSHIKGGMRSSIEQIRDSLFEVISKIEAAIDFHDDVGDLVKTDDLLSLIQNKVVAPLTKLINQYRCGHVFRDGLKIVIVGRPNVGKSSLINSLIKKDRVIVASVPGTTRDLIEETINIEGIPIIITDTAGIHDSEDLIESISIQKTYEYVHKSDLIIFVVDNSCCLTKDDYKIYDKIKDKRVLLVINKTDIENEHSVFTIPYQWKNMSSVKISALYGRGVDNLKNLIAAASNDGLNFNVESEIIPNTRQKVALDRCLESTSNAVEGILKETPFELIAIDLHQAFKALEVISGIDVSDDVLEQIFNRFCIGK